MKTFIFLLILQVSWLASAALETKQAHSVAQLVFEEQAITPGRNLVLGLYLELEDGWHSYWSNPGDSGATPQFKWKVPEGFVVTGPFFSVPERIEVGSAVNFGYQKEAFYRFELQNNLTQVSSRSIPISLHAEWLVCSQICIPAQFQFDFSFPVSAELEPSPKAPLIARFQRTLPEPVGPLNLDWKVEEDETLLEIRDSSSLEVIDVFPKNDWKVDLKKPKIERKGNSTLVTFKGPKSGLPENPALLVFRRSGEGDTIHSTELTGRGGAAPQSTSGFLGAFLFAFLGGLLLNLMPCVFPVLSIKVFSVLEQAGKGKAWVRHSSLVYAAGILVSFSLLGLTLAALRSWGEAVGWGFQLQNPYLLVILIFLFLCLGASFLGGIDLSWLQVGAGQSLTNQAGWTGEFFSGVLCVVVASPCTAPFMGAALGYAISQPLPVLMTVFLALGIGLSFPYLILATVPQAARVLPRPGLWMETVKEVMAFPLFATVIWLLWVLAQSATPFAGIGVLTGALVSGIGLWAHRRKKKKRWVAFLGVALSLFGVFLSLWIVRRELALGSGAVSLEKPSHGIQWQAFNEEKAKEFSLQGKSVFVDFTASWCVTCQVNEEVTFSSQAVKEFIRDQEIIMMKADWTKADPEITKALKAYDRIGVPFYVAYLPGVGSGKGLGEIMTPKIFMNAFEKK